MGSGRRKVAALATAAVGGLSRRLRMGSGSVVGGRVGLAVDPGLLSHAGRGRTAALVTGTNGKTTTTRLLVAALGGSQALSTNATGSNLPAGLVAALVARPGSRAVLEVDEGYLGGAVEALEPSVVLLLNLSRDQLDRVNEVRKVAGRLRRALGHFAGTVVANADDPLVVWAAQGAQRVVWVGAGQLWHADAAGCPACDGPVVFDESPARWASDCGFSRPDPALWLDDATLAFADGRRIELGLALPGRANRANAAMAAAAAEVLGVAAPDAIEAMGEVRAVEGRFETLRVGDLAVRLLLAKNPAGWAELLELLHGGDEPVVVGINARVADGHDPSWLWDVEFERLRGRTVVATGERASDLAVRLRYAAVAHLTVPDQLAALRATEAPSVEYVGNYTAFQQLRRALRAPALPGAGPARLVGARAVPDAVESVTVRGPDRPSALRVVVVYPDLLGTYGDGGNALVLASRAAWRGLDVELVVAGSSSALPASGDLYCLGGGEDAPQVLAAARLAAAGFPSVVEAGATVLAVCAGYQIVGRSFPDAEGHVQGGLGILDVTTVKGPGRRAVGELLAEARPVSGLAEGLLTGFENHGGVTRLGTGVEPLATVRVGVGNGDATEGALSGKVLGTYLHGPALARNPALADLLLSMATGTELAPLDDAEHAQLRAERLAALRRRVRR